MQNKTNKSATKIDEDLYSRQLFVLGHEAMKNISSSNILFIGLSGPATEILKNCILAGVNSVTLFDNSKIEIEDLGYNFYFKEDDVNKEKDVILCKALRNLNSYVNVRVLSNNNTNNQNKEYSYLSKINLDDVINSVNFSEYTTVIVSNVDNQLAEDINNKARESGTKFIYTHVRGFFSQTFVDVGKNFVCNDLTGEPLKIGIGNLFCKDDAICLSTTNRNEIEKGVILRIKEEVFEVESEIKWEMEFEVLERKTGKILILKQNNNNSTINSNNLNSNIDISNLDSFKEYLKINIDTNVSFEEKRVQKLFSSETLTNTLKDSSDGLILCEPQDLKISKIIKNCFRSLCMFNSRNSNNDSDNLNLFINIYKEKFGEIDKENEELIKGFYETGNGTFVPLISTIGGFVSQEVLKTVSGKFKPLIGFWYYDCYSSFNKILKLFNFFDANNLNSDGNINKRYSTLYKLLGNGIFEIFKSSPFVVGAGAIGCEHLKNLSMLGFASSNSNKKNIFVTDMDSIEVSNLNRQFLFNSSNIGSMKSTTAAKAIKMMNPSVNVKYYTNRIDDAIFDSSFLGEVDFFANALDNIDARLYVDSLAISNSIALFDSGTLGTKGNTQCVIPYLSESYGSSNDPPEVGIPLCTLKNFPNSHIHTIEFGLSEFKRLFEDDVVNLQSNLSKLEDIYKYPNTVKREENTEKFPNLAKTEENINSINIENLQKDLEGELDLKEIKEVLQYPINLAELVISSLKLFHVIFYLNVKKILDTFPLDHLNNDGTSFWDHKRKRPKVINFDKNEKDHILFIYSAVNVYSQCSDIDSNSIKMQDIENVIENELELDEIFKNIEKMNIDIKIEDLDNSININTDNLESNKKTDNNLNTNNLEFYNKNFYTKEYKKNYIDIAKRVESLISNSKSLKTVKFEKDDSNNFHVKFIHLLSKLRCINYKIKECTEHETKGIAGKIIPAIATTTAMVSGLSVIEMVKYILIKGVVERLANKLGDLNLNNDTNINLNDIVNLNNSNDINLNAETSNNTNIEMEKNLLKEIYKKIQKIPQIYISKQKIDSIILNSIFDSEFNNITEDKSSENTTKDKSNENENALDLFNNTYVNLSIPYIVFSSPFQCFNTDCPITNTKISLWDKISIPNLELEGIIEFFRKCKLTVSMISLYDKILFCTFMNIEEKYDHIKVMDIYKSMNNTDKNITKLELDVMVDEVEDFPKVIVTL